MNHGHMIEGRRPLKREELTTLRIITHNQKIRQIDGALFTGQYLADSTIASERAMVGVKP